MVDWTARDSGTARKIVIKTQKQFLWRVNMLRAILF